MQSDNDSNDAFPAIKQEKPFEISDVSCENPLLETHESDKNRCLYPNIEVTAFVRDCNHFTNGIFVGQWNISCNSVAEFNHLLWSQCKPFVHREIIYQKDGPLPVFSEEITPQKENDKFLLIHNKTSKLYKTLSEITKKDLKMWSRSTTKCGNMRKIFVYIHRYSLAIYDKNVFDLCIDTLLSPIMVAPIGKKTFFVFFFNELQNMIFDHHTEELKFKVNLNENLLEFELKNL